MQRRAILTNTAVTIASAIAAPAVIAQNQRSADNGVPFFMVDAFTDSAFSGNPAPVVLLKTWLPDQKMQALAAEMNMSEVAFVIRDEASRWQIRWFTPVKEVPLNGHATLAAASVIFERIAPDLQVINFSAKGGQLTVKRDKGAYLMNFPMDPAPKQVEIPAQAEEDLGVKPSEYWVNARNIAVFRNADEVAAVKSKLTKQTAWTEGRHLMITAPGKTDSVDYVLRYFVPLLNIPEDPVSGVVHCTLAPFWASRLGKTEFQVEQLSSRGGKARTGVEGGRVLIGGPCVTYVAGNLLI